MFGPCKTPSHAMPQRTGSSWTGATCNAPVFSGTSWKITQLSLIHITFFLSVFPEQFLDSFNSSFAQKSSKNIQNPQSFGTLFAELNTFCSRLSAIDIFFDVWHATLQKESHFPSTIFRGSVCGDRLFVRFFPSPSDFCRSPPPPKNPAFLGFLQL